MSHILTMLFIVFLLYQIISIECYLVSNNKVIPTVDTTVWSLATLNEDKTTNMNIITYAYPISLRPQPLWAISLYKDTLTHENFFRQGYCILQQLTEDHINLIELLGKTSGYYNNKLDELKKLNVPLQQIQFSLPDKRSNEFATFDIIANSPHVLHLEQGDNEIVNAGDHDVIFCNILKCYKQEVESPHSVLKTGHLRRLGLI